jgi:endoglucanase
LTVRYWYTWEDTGSITQTFEPTYFLNNSDMTSEQLSYLTGTFVAVAPVTGADHYLQVGFLSAAGNLAAGTFTRMGLGMKKNDNTSYTQTGTTTGDYSYNGSTTFMSTTKVTVYITTTTGTALVYGTEPM